MDLSTHYGLGKPLPGENYDVTVPNANMDKIDGELKSLNDKHTATDFKITLNLTGTTDADGYVTVNHGAGFTPRAIVPFIHKNATTACNPISVAAITATQVTVRCADVFAGGLAVTKPLNSALGLVCYR